MSLTRNRLLTVVVAMFAMSDAIVALAGTWFINIPSGPMDYTPTNTVFSRAYGYGFVAPPAPVTTVAFRHTTSSGGSVCENFVTVTGTPITEMSGYTFWEWQASIPPAPVTWEISPYTAWWPFNTMRLRDKYIESQPTGLSQNHVVNP